MPSLSTGINIALQAVLAQSQAIEIVEHNVANANTVGYRRQSAVLAASGPTQSYGADHGLGAGQRGTGVTVAQIQRFSLDFFDGRYRGSLAEAKSWEMQKGVMIQMEQTLAETSENGLLPKLDEFWNGWQQVSSDPANTSLRADLLENAAGLVNGFKRRAEQLIQLRSDQNNAVTSRVGEINSLAGQVASLNGEISRVLSLGEQPNDLLDQRDMLLDRLAEVGGASASMQKNGEVVVSIAGHVLVTGQTAQSLTTTPDPITGLAQVAWTDGQSFTPSTGELQGFLTVRDTLIPQQQAGLDQLAQAVANSVNSLHQTGYGLDGTTTNLPFFTGSTALTLNVNPAVTVNTLGASSAPAVAGVPEPGNNTIAMAIANLKTAKGWVAGSTGTISEFYNGQVTQLGLQIQRSKDSAASYGAVARAMSDQRESVSGVSLDEEAANLAKYQKAYQAAARVMTTYDDLLDRIINGMGMVGR